MTSCLLSLRRLFGFAAITCLAACGGGGDEPDSPQHRAELVQALASRLQALHRQHPTLPGFVAHVLVRPAHLSWGGSVGIADRATARALTPNATFRIASITKTFSAAAVYRLAESGRLSTSDSIERHLLPATLAALRAGGYDTATITVEHLLTHTSGLRDFVVSQEYLGMVLTDPGRRWSRDDQVALAMSLGGPLWPPGGAFEYSDTGYILLGEVIETKTGLQLGAAYRSLLGLAALGLVATYQESVDAVPAAAGPKALQDFVPGLDNSGVDASTDLWGGGGLVSDARDLALFMQALFEGKVLTASSLSAMLSPAIVATGQTTGAHGLFRVDLSEAACWGHDGFWGAVAVHCPALGVTMAGSFNASPLAQPPEAALQPFDLASEIVAAIKGVR